MLQIEGAVCRVLGRTLLLLAVVAGAQLLCLDLGASLLALGLGLLPSASQGGKGVLLLLLGHPAVDRSAGCLADRGAADAVAACIACLGPGRDPRMAMGGQVLVKLIDVESLDVGDHVAAQLTDIHISEVDIELAAGAFLHRATLSLQVGFAIGQVGFRGGGGCWGTLGLA